MPMSHPELSDADRELHFPLTRARIGTGTFEIGLALAGTVSAGAYTAGVLDYLIEALDAWTLAKQRGDPEAPPHQVAISTIAGASGGAINGAIFLRAAGFAFPHGESEGNPLFSAWAGAKSVTLEDLLAPGSSIDGAGPLALLNTKAIENQARTIVGFAGKPLGANEREMPPNREYLSDPLRLIATIGNVTGIPYRISFRGDTGLGHDMIAHNDAMRFALTVPGGIERPDAASRADEYALSSVSPANWDFVLKAALATSAFPIAFDARSIDRTADQLRYRAILVPGAGDNWPDVVVPLRPRWPAIAVADGTGVSSATTVDGGTIDNEPIGIVRRELAGMTGRNPREETEAERAVVLIDPFTDAENPAASPKSLFGLVSQLFGLFLQQARYKPEDIALAFNESVYSRFLVAPRDKAGTGSWVLASGKLGGFKGFLDRKLLVHDFRLGRYDAYLFLSRDFRFPPDNIVFKERPWSDDQRRIHTSGVYDYTDQPVEERDYLPMIPLMKSLRDAPPVEPTRQPLVALAGSLSGLIDTRLDFVFGKLLEEFSSGGKGVSAGTMRTLVKSAWSLWGRATVRNRVLAALAGALDSPETD